MKKVNLKLLVPGLLGLSLIVLGACNPQPKKEAAPAMAAEPAEVKRPSQIIPLAEADSLYVNYTNKRAISIVKMEMRTQSDDAEPFEPTRFVSFDLKVIKEYIAYVEQEAINRDTQVDSLRIYLGNYGATSEKDLSRNTVFIVPAAKAEGGYGGIYIGEDDKMKLMRNYWKNTSGGGQEGEPKSEASFMPNFSAILMQDDGSLVLNYGNTGPPPSGDF